MLRSICQRILGAFRTNNRCPVPPRALPRRLTMESLESRKLLSIATTLTAGSISDGSFEAPALPTTGLPATRYLTHRPSVRPDLLGIRRRASANGSTFTSGDPNAPDGAEVAYIQGLAFIKQIVNLDGGIYNLSLLAAQRVQNQSQNQVLEVLIDNKNVGTIAPPGPVKATPYSYGQYESLNFQVTAGLHTVELLGTVNADATIFIDAVTITPVVDSVADGGFEEPGLAVNTAQYNPSGGAWQFSATAGVSRNGSSFQTNWINEAQNAPAGMQVGFLQGNGTMSQTVYLDLGTYQISFLAAQRVLSQSNYEEIEFEVDGQLLLNGGTATRYRRPRKRKHSV